MVVYYQIAGKKVGSHVLAMATLGTIFAGSWAAAGGGSKPKTAAGPPSTLPPRKRVTSSSTNFLKEVDGGDKKPASGH
ncbi:hypothetical protein N7494_008802 [Penicillium frequentans]|uniref:Uncharacterized protein n=1 Tax=Penicillium frequentans TaxID=3151616 RepID=A0AAD6GB23_9EURO|nr:hypothetical protein N7494_008802 [Penicillium glabrum]